MKINWRKMISLALQICNTYVRIRVIILLHLMFKSKIILKCMYISTENHVFHSYIFTFSVSFSFMYALKICDVKFPMKTLSFY